MFKGFVVQGRDLVIVDVDYNYHEVTDVDELEKIGAEYFKAVGTQGSSTVETVNGKVPMPSIHSFGFLTMIRWAPSFT